MRFTCATDPRAFLATIARLQSLSTHVARAITSYWGCFGSAPVRL